jgi:hypothetical protein
MDDGAAEVCGDYIMQPSAAFSRRRAVASATPIGKIARAREGIADASRSWTTHTDRSFMIARVTLAARILSAVIVRPCAGDGDTKMSNSRYVSRRSFIGGAALLAGAAATPGLIVCQTALAQQKVAPASVKYQDKPNGNQQCSNCLQFVPGGTPTAMGTCKVVEGPVSPSGYCIIWVAKP